jgi:hypothetical protein
MRSMTAAPRAPTGPARTRSAPGAKSSRVKARALKVPCAAAAGMTLAVRSRSALSSGDMATHEPTMATTPSTGCPGKL